MWLTNIENAADAVAAEYGSEVAQSVFQRYDAHGTHDLSLFLQYINALTNVHCIKLSFNKFIVY